MRQFSRSTAVTLTEMMLALAVAASIAMAAVYYFQGANDAAKVTRAVKEFRPAVQAVLDFTATQPTDTWASIGTGGLIDAGYLPESYRGRQGDLWNTYWFYRLRGDTETGHFEIFLGNSKTRFLKKHCDEIAKQLVQAGLDGACQVDSAYFWARVRIYVQNL